ncbi:MAG TPA: hypothetical protein PKX39_14150, partial [Flavobacteriales bacterium]|nr:hypothetical protein [Flavobacteriales bacterium]
SAPVTTQLTASNATADLPLDAIECFSFTGVLDPGPCAGCTYVWQPGGETTATLPVDITETTTFSVTATQGNCSVSDSTTITIENCTGIAAAGTDGVVVGPVPVVRGQEVVVSGIAPGSLLRLSTLDGRYVGASFIATGTRTLIPTTGLAAGGYLLHGADERPLRIVVVE